MFTLSFTIAITPIAASPEAQTPPATMQLTSNATPSRPVRASETYHRLDLDGIPEVGQARALGAWWPQIVDVSEIVPPGTPPLMLIASTDHADGDEPGGGIYVWRSMRPEGPWQFDGQLFASNPPYRQMEAPTAHVLTDPLDGQQKLFVWAHYVPLPQRAHGPQAHRQVSVALVSPDGVAPLEVIAETELDAAQPAYSMETEPYNAHLGYLSVMPNIFDGLVNPETGQPWAFIGTSMYGSRISRDRIYGRALWGLESPRAAPTLVERYVFDRRFVSGAPPRTIDAGNIGVNFKDPDGALWGLFMVGGSGGFELRAVRLDQWAQVTSTPLTLFRAEAIDPADYPAPFTAAARLKSPQVLTTYRSADGQIWALANAVLQENDIPSTNVTFAIPLDGQTAPEQVSARGLLMRYDGQSVVTLAETPEAFEATENIDLEDGEAVVEPDGTSWDVLNWQSPEPLYRYQMVRFAIDGFSDDSEDVPPNQSDLWVFAAPVSAGDPMSAEGAFAGANLATSVDGRAGFAVQGPDAPDHAPQPSPLLSIGRGIGDGTWRYDLGVAVWPEQGQAGVTHGGDSLVETLSLPQLNLSEPWRFGVAIRRAEPNRAHATRIRNVRVITALR